MRPVTLLIIPAAILALSACRSTAGAGSAGLREAGGSQASPLPTSGGAGVAAVIAPISNLETSTNHTAKFATVKNDDGTAVRINRCHQMGLQTPFLEFTVCRDAAYEFLMDNVYGADAERWARLRTADGKESVMRCKQLSSSDFSSEAYGSLTVQECKPTEPNANGQKFLALMDAPLAPENMLFLTRNVYLPTTRDTVWRNRLAAALPDGEYVGHSTTQSKECKVVVANGNITILTSAGKKLGSVELGDNTVFASALVPSVKQSFDGKNRDAAVFLVSVETETKTQAYYSRNLRIVRVADQPANADAGHTTVVVGEVYCQRLRPAGAEPGTKLPAPAWN